MKPPMRLHCPVLLEGDRIPVECTCDGDDRSLPIGWENVPYGTNSFAVIVDDPDAPHPYFVHWLAWNIPGEWTRLDPGCDPDDERFAQGTNGFGNVGWSGPCPPRDHGPHRYVVRVFALDAMLDLEPGANRAALEAAIHGHALASAELVARYERRRGMSAEAPPPA